MRFVLAAKLSLLAVPVSLCSASIISNSFVDTNLARDLIRENRIYVAEYLDLSSDEHAKVLPPNTPQAQSDRPMRVRISQGVSTGMLVKKVPPHYPPLARQARIQGTVILKALINTQGDIEDLTLVSGHPMLAPAAIDAVKQWKYTPYLLNGRAVQVETQIQINFQLSGNPVPPTTVEVPPPIDLNKYPGLLNAFGELLVRLQREMQVPPQRQRSQLLPLLPETTIFYAAFPNYGEALHQGLAVFQQELKRSGVLHDWWQGEISKNGSAIEDSVDKAYQLSQYLGDEIVIDVLRNGSGEPKLLILANVKKPGLKEFLQQLSLEDFAGSRTGMEIFDARELIATKESDASRKLTVVVRPDLALGSDLATVRDLNSQIDRSGANFASTPFGQRLLRSYEGGTAIVAGADLQSILRNIPRSDQSQAILERTGFGDMQYAVWEHKDVEGQAASQAELSFIGPRHGAASWLVSPSPLGSLDFVSPRALLAGAVHLKNLGEVFDGIKDMLTISNSNALRTLPQMEEMLHVSLRDDLFSHFTGEMALEVDGPLEPQPTVKAILRVDGDPALPTALAKLLTASRLGVSESEEAGTVFHSIRVPSAQKPFEIDYAFVGGYLIIASSHDTLADAIHLHQTGESLAKSKKFLDFLPPGHSADASALLYEDPMAMAALNMRRLSPELAASLTQPTAETTPVVVGVYGEGNAIREASRSGGVDAGMILVGAAIAVPNLLRARMAANEASAAATVRTLDTAEVMYASTYPDKGYARDMAALGSDSRPAGGLSADHAIVIDAALGNPGCGAGAWCIKSGYRFSLAAICTKGKCGEFVVTATPVNGSTGTKNFCSTSDGVARFQIGNPLSSPLSASECQSWGPLQ